MKVVGMSMVQAAEAHIYMNMSLALLILVCGMSVSLAIDGFNLCAAKFCVENVCGTCVEHQKQKIISYV